MDRRTFLAGVALGATTALAGCQQQSIEETPVPEENEQVNVEELEVEDKKAEPAERVDGKPFSSTSKLEELSEVQRNSVNMMNYIAVLMQQVIASKSNRLQLESLYSDLLNNVSPNAVDANTLDEIEQVLDTLENYRMLSVKRDRLKIIYERAQADAIKQAIPNPLTLLSAIESRNAAQLLASAVYMAIDSAASYTSAMSDAETEYMQSGWELDDQESENLHNARKEMFSYTVQTVSEYGLPGSIALNEEAVSSFVSWEGEQVANRLRFFEKNSDVYCGLGAYWLLLAQSYQEHANYEECIRAIEVYEQYSTGILRKDRTYAKALSVALLACEELDEQIYLDHGKRWAEAILLNSAEDDWALRYYAAQTYVALAGKSEDSGYLALAYETALDNANELLAKQRDLNDAYLAPLAKIDGAASFPWSSDEEKERDSYNKMLEDERKVELAPLYEPLLMNLELIRAICTEHPEVVPDTAAADEIIHGAGSLFLVPALDAQYTFSGGDSSQDVAGIVYDCTELRVPATLVTASAAISSEVIADGETTTIDDWSLDHVDRNDSEDISAFAAVYKSASAKDVQYEDGCEVNLQIDPCPKWGLPQIGASFRANSTKKMPWDNLALWDDGFSFEQL